MTATRDQHDRFGQADGVGLDVRPMSGHIGAEISGVDLAEPLDPTVVAAIRSTLVRWKVVFFRDQDITQTQHVAFARRFGEPTPAHPILPAVFPEHPEILLLDYQKLLAKDATGEAPVFENRWHTDVTFLPDPPMGSILRGVTVPAYGGDTQWTNLAAAYQRLSPPVQELIDGLRAVHQNNLSKLARGEMTPAIKAMYEPEMRAIHPVVRVHPESGEKVLFVNPNFTSHIVELSRQESRHLLAMLYEQLADPEITVRFRWEPGSIAFWDNRATAHLIPSDMPPGSARSMQRITLAGDHPVGPHGFTSTAC